MLYHTTVSVCIPILFCTIDKSEIFCPGLISLNFSHSFVTYCYFCLIETTFHSFGHLYGCYFLTSGSLFLIKNSIENKMIYVTCKIKIININIFYSCSQSYRLFCSQKGVLYP